MKKLRALIPLLISGLLLWSATAGGSRPEASAGTPCAECGAAVGISGTRDTLFAQSAGRVLREESEGNQVSYLLLDARSGKLLASSWENPQEPIPFGSLLKPFLALAYGQNHDFRFPSHFCRGTSSGCWLAGGHGRSDIEAAIANSCNSYFRVLTANMTGEDVGPTARSFGLDAPGSNLSGPALFGLGDAWLITPLRMAQAYLELNRRRDQPGVREVLAGMAESGQEGTGAEVDRALKFSHAMVKTGTAVCTHKDRAPGDGFAVAMLPEEQPRIILLVRVHGVPGAKASAVAGRMLRRLGE